MVIFIVSFQQTFDLTLYFRRFGHIGLNLLTHKTLAFIILYRALQKAFRLKCR